MKRREFIGLGAAAMLPGMLVAREGRAKVPLMLDTKRFAIHDGPGVRTTFFVKGCPLKCIWCHNPESIKSEAQWARFQHLCKHHEHCTMDEATCPTRALKLYGKPMTIDALLPYVDMWLPDYKADDDALHQKCTGVSNAIVKANLERLVAANAKMEVRCLVVPGCTDGADIAARHRYLNSIGIPESSIVNLEYFDYARSKYLALGMKDTMPIRGK